MRKFFTLFLVSLTTISASLAQKEVLLEHKVLTYTGETHSGNLLVYQTPILQASYFQLDEKRFATAEVSQFQNDHGYFSNLSKIHGEKTERYALRTHTGKIDVYEEIELELYGGPVLAVEFPEDEVKSMNPELATGNYVQYYIKGDQMIKKSTFKNLDTDLADNAESSILMGKYKKYRWIQWGMLATGASLIAVSMASQSAEEMKMTPMIALGIVIGGGSYLLENPKEKAIWAAVENYNK